MSNTGHTPSVEERLRRARGFAAVLSRLAHTSAAMSNDAPPPAFWSGVTGIADLLEDDIAAIGKALDVDAKACRAPDVYVEK